MRLLGGATTVVLVIVALTCYAIRSQYGNDNSLSQTHRAFGEIAFGVGKGGSGSVHESDQDDTFKQERTKRENKLLVNGTITTRRKARESEDDDDDDDDAKEKNVTVSTTNSGGSSLQLPGLVIGDPHFTGFRGQKFDFMGRPGATFNILSDKGLTMNARFVAGPNKKEQTFMKAIGLKFEDVELKIQECGFRRICAYLDGVEVRMGEVKMTSSRAVVKKKAHTVERIEVDIPSQGYKFKFISPKPDKWNMPHLDIYAALTKIPADPHGVLGQTARCLKAGGYNVGVKEINEFKPEGTELDYAVSHLFSHDFKYNRHTTATSGLASMSRRLLSEGEKNLGVVAVAHVATSSEKFWGL